MRNTPQHFPSIVCLLVLLLVGCSLDEMNQTCEVTGLVTGLNGTPLENVTIVLQTATQTFESQTDATGTYRFGGLSTGIGVLTFSKETYQPATAKLAMPGGQTATHDQVLRTVITEKEGASLQVITLTQTIHNNTVEAAIPVMANIPFTVSSTAEWIQISEASFSQSATVYIQTEPNEELTGRTAEIIFTGLYGLTQQATITQEAGPVLRITGMENNDDCALALKEGIYVHYNRPVEIVEVTKTSNATVINQGKTVHIRQLDMQLFQEATLQLTVKSSDAIQLSTSFKFQAFEGKYADGNNSLGNLFLANNDEFCWMRYSWGSQKLIQMPNMQLIKDISSIPMLSDPICNPATNQMYIRQSKGATYTLGVYNATTAAFVKELTFPNSTSFHSLVFNKNGIGLLLSGSGIYTIDSQQDNQIKQLLYDNTAPHHIDLPYVTQALPINQGKGFLIYSSIQMKDLLYVDLSTGAFKSLGDQSEYQYCLSNPDRQQAILYSSYEQKVKTIDCETGVEKVYPAPSGNAPFLLKGEQEDEYLIIINRKKLYALHCATGVTKELTVPDYLSTCSTSPTQRYVVLHHFDHDVYRSIYHVFRTDVLKQLITALP